MSVTASELSSALVDAYRAHPSRAGFDELVDANGVRPHAEALAATVAGMGIGGLLAARAEAVNQVADEGISYGAAASGVRQPWLIDPLPLPLDGADWLTLERGLAQRAVLLDAVLADLYSDRTLLRRKVLPAAAVLGHPGFTRMADRIGTSNRRQLVLTATDVGRDAVGRWRVISDRTQAPAGAGYAMATRRIVSRVLAGLHRTSDLARLRGFFHAMTGALLDAAPGGTEIPRVVLLSPGAASETAFDQAFLATMLGFPLAEADDLVVSKGRVWLRAGGELEPVDVILRRVEAMLSDPLEFRGNSEVGLPGMVETARQGAVTVVNPVGAGVLDNPALIAHLRPVAQALLGEDPLLDSPDTWWCGDPTQASHVLANLDSLVIKPVARTGGTAVRYGWLLDAAERAELVDRINDEPWAWCGQEPIELSTAPVVTPAGLEPRRFVLRTFGVATGDGYTFLPGGLGRVAAGVNERTVSSAGTGRARRASPAPAADPRAARDGRTATGRAHPDGDRQVRRAGGVDRAPCESGRRPQRGLQLPARNPGRRGRSLAGGCGRPHHAHRTLVCGDAAGLPHPGRARRVRPRRRAPQCPSAHRRGAGGARPDERRHLERVQSTGTDPCPASVRGRPAAVGTCRRAGVTAGLCRDHGPEHGARRLLGVPRRGQPAGTGTAHRLAAASGHGRSGRPGDGGARCGCCPAGRREHHHPPAPGRLRHRAGHSSRVGAPTTGARPGQPAIGRTPAGSPCRRPSPHRRRPAGRAGRGTARRGGRSSRGSAGGRHAATPAPRTGAGRPRRADRRPSLRAAGHPQDRRDQLVDTVAGGLMVAQYGPRRYRVSHVTRYSYDDVLEACYNRGLLRPRDTPHQQVQSSDVVATPPSDEMSTHTDYFGNHSVYLESRAPATELTISATSVVAVDWSPPDLASLDAWTVADAVAAIAGSADPVEFAEFTLPSPLVAIGPMIHDYAGEVLAPGRPLGEAIAALLHRIHADFSYRQGATSVKTTLTELLDLRRGVCQDFAHLAVGCLRAAGLPARYVSGYLETAPPPGKEKLRGADATHAWASVLTPTGEWVDLDPTNDNFADSRYIVTAWGRDFSDVSPLRGVVFTEAGSSDLVVEVDVEPLPLYEPEPLAI